MNTLNVRLKMILATIALTTSTVACSSGSLPAELSQSSNVANTVAAAPIPDLRLSIDVPSVLVGGFAQVTVEGGVAPFTLTSSNPAAAALSTSVLPGPGSVSLSGTAAGSLTLTVTDARGLTSVTSLAVTVPAPVISRATRAIYSFSFLHQDISNLNRMIGQTYHRQTDATSMPSGWTPLGLSYYVFVNQVPDSRALNQCLDSENQTFETLDAQCEGKTFSRVLGFVLPPDKVNVPGTVALNRSSFQFWDQRWDSSIPPYGNFAQLSTGHLDQFTTSFLAAPADFSPRGVLGFAPSAPQN